jgi:hypothetical protein
MTWFLIVISLHMLSEPNVAGPPLTREFAVLMARDALLVEMGKDCGFCDAVTGSRVRTSEQLRSQWDLEAYVSPDA